MTIQQQAKSIAIRPTNGGDDSSSSSSDSDEEDAAGQQPQQVNQPARIQAMSG